MDISPKLVDIQEEDKTLVWEAIIPFEQSTDSPPDDLSLSIANVKERIRQKVGKLHDAGYCHGDLHIGNIGYRPSESDGQDIYFVDFDTCFKIDTKNPQPWVIEWMRNGFGEESYEDFIDYDWHTWNTDFLFESSC